LVDETPPLPLTSAEPPKFQPTNGVSVQSADAVRGENAEAAAATTTVKKIFFRLMVASSLP
jgi:hypothetical protein